jgi:hypothetical protein
LRLPCLSFRPPFFVGNIEGTSLLLSSLLGGEAWIVYIVNHYRRAHSKISRDRTFTACLTARQVLADLAGMGATACSQPKPHDDVGELHAMRLAISQRVSSSSLRHWLSPERERCRSCKPRFATNASWRVFSMRGIQQPGTRRDAGSGPY